MTHLTIARSAAALAPFALAALTAALTVKARYDPLSDEVTITIRKIRPVTAALATFRAR